MRRIIASSRTGAVTNPLRYERMALGRVLSLPLLLLLGVLLSACASAGTSAPRRSTDLITREELANVDLPSAYEAVQRLRPQWLRGRGSSTSMSNTDPALPVVYVSGMRQGSLDALRSVRVNDVQEMRFINSADATTRWGTGHLGGAIEVITR